MTRKHFHRKLVLLYLSKINNLEQANNTSSSREHLAQQAWSFATTVAANEPSNVDDYGDARWAEYKETKQ